MNDSVQTVIAKSAYNFPACVCVCCVDWLEDEEAVNENEADCVYAIYSQIMNQ